MEWYARVLIKKIIYFTCLSLFFFFLIIYILLDKTGVNQKLSIEGSIIVDDSAVISCRHSEDGKEPVLVGTVKKSLSQESWWKTDSNIESNSQKHIMVCTRETKTISTMTIIRSRVFSNR